MQGTVGDHIQSVAKGDTQQKLWSFVSSFSENNMDGDKLSHLYHKLRGNKTTPSGKSLSWHLTFVTSSLPPVAKQCHSLTYCASMLLAQVL